MHDSWYSCDYLIFIWIKVINFCWVGFEGFAITQTWQKWKNYYLQFFFLRYWSNLLMKLLNHDSKRLNWLAMVFNMWLQKLLSILKTSGIIHIIVVVAVIYFCLWFYVWLGCVVEMDIGVGMPKWLSVKCALHVLIQTCVHNYIDIDPQFLIKNAFAFLARIDFKLDDSSKFNYFIIFRINCTFPPKSIEKFLFCLLTNNFLILYLQLYKPLQSILTTNNCLESGWKLQLRCHLSP